MQTFEYMKDFGFAASHYIVSNQTVAMEKDGQQSLAIGVLATKRLHLIINEIKMHTPELNVHFTFTWIPCILGTLASCAYPLAESYLNTFPNPVTDKEKMLTAACKLLVQTGKLSHGILQHADKILNAASLINAVALISFGFPVNGSIALFGLFVLTLKRYQHLPASVERYIHPITVLGALATTITIDINIIFKIIAVAIDTMPLIALVLNSQIIRPLLPARFTNPFHNKHVMSQGPKEQKIALENATKPQNIKLFRTDPTHVYSDEIGRLLPTECDQSLEQISASELFDQLTAKMNELKIELDDGEKEGLDNLKICAITGRVGDTSPSDIELFQKIIKYLVQSILNDDDNFEIRAQEFANLGLACVEGWTRDITAMLSPQTKEAAWAVHHVLAKMRGEIVKETILKYNKILPVLNMAGGSNNIHITNAVQAAFWHRLRTFEGELDKQLHKPSPLNALFLRHVVMNDNTENPHNLEQFYMLVTLFSVHPALNGFMGGFSGNLIMNMLPEITDAAMDSEKIVNSIYDAIKPEYKPASDGRNDRMEPKRVIAWEAITTWMGDLAEKRNIHICDPETYVFNPLFVEHDMAGEPYLTKSGVILLLWDLGILRVIL